MAKGVNWNDYPAFFRRGTYLRRMPAGDGHNPVSEYPLRPLRRYTHEERVKLLFGPVSPVAEEGGGADLSCVEQPSVAV
jgi:hypothetical protein